jgi:hypothetical protein
MAQYESIGFTPGGRDIQRRRPSNWQPLATGSEALQDKLFGASGKHLGGRERAQEAYRAIKPQVHNGSRNAADAGGRTWAHPLKPYERELSKNARQETRPLVGKHVPAREGLKVAMSMAYKSEGIGTICYVHPSGGWCSVRVHLFFFQHHSFCSPLTPVTWLSPCEK